MTKVVYNASYGGFGLSNEAQELYFKLKGWKYTKEKNSWGRTTYTVQGQPDFYDGDIDRHDPTLVQVVETLGPKANGSCANLVVGEVVSSYRIEEYDGNEFLMKRDDYDWTTP